MLRFRTQLPHSLINPNELCASGIHVNDDPFDSTRNFGINSEQAFIPFDTTGTVVHLYAYTDRREKTHLPVHQKLRKLNLEVIITFFFRYNMFLLRNMT
jgi:hypothetical protein